jgi:hypothetical protein
MTSRPSTAARILATLAIVAALLGAYVGAYFWLGVARPGYVGNNLVHITRTYPFQWEALAFEPAAGVEGLVRGVGVTVAYQTAEDLRGIVLRTAFTAGVIVVSIAIACLVRRREGANQRLAADSELRHYGQDNPLSASPPSEDDRSLARWGTTGFVVGGVIASLIAYQLHPTIEETFPAALGGAAGGALALVLVRLQLIRLRS